MKSVQLFGLWSCVFQSYTYIIFLEFSFIFLCFRSDQMELFLLGKVCFLLYILGILGKNHKTRTFTTFM